ncbi:MAG: fatty acid desaturase, partial [Myxococcales bacterium]|nr:fatty acid desaturase [Myxococcales bacterium]
LSFMLLGLPTLARYLLRSPRRPPVKRLVAGEAFYWISLAALATFHWQATVTVFVIPLFLIRFLMMAGNWGQHSFVDTTDPLNAYRNSITCIDSRYNRRCFNDGYHIGHHLDPQMHWSELPVAFEAQRQEYAKQGAIVFKHVDFFMVWAMLMVRAYGTLASLFVDLQEPPRPKEEIIALLKSRARRPAGGAAQSA